MTAHQRVRLRRFSVLLPLALVAIAQSSGAAVRGAKSESSAHGLVLTSKPVWVNKTVDVVGGPIVSGSTLVVTVSGPGRTLWLDGISASSGSTRWRVQITDSFITPGVPDSPAVVDGVALALLTTPSAIAGAALLAGISIETGKTLWRAAGPAAVNDVPTVCPGLATAFCLPVQASATESALVALDAKTGRAVDVVPHIERGLDAGVYQSDGAVEYIEGISIPAGVIWSARVVTTFPGGDLNGGWDFEPVGHLQLGTVGPAGSGNTHQLFGNQLTEAFDSSGKLHWKVPGAYDCEGSFNVTGQYLCIGTGTATESAATLTITTSPGATLQLKGLDPSTGKMTWTFQVGDISKVLLGSDVRIRDSSHVLIPTSSGALTVLDVATGSTSRPQAGEGFWCQHQSTYSVAPVQGQTALRIAVPRVFPCSSMGSPFAAEVPTTALAGVIAGKLFVWVSSSGLTAGRI